MSGVSIACQKTCRARRLQAVSNHSLQWRPQGDFPLGMYVAKNTLRYPRPRGTGLGRPDG